MENSSTQTGESASWFEAIVLGIFTSGVNKPTAIALNFVLVALLSVLLFLCYVAVGYGGWLLLHTLFLVFLAGGLLFLINWFIAETGIVSTEEQTSELMGPSAKNKDEPPKESDGAIATGSGSVEDSERKKKSL